MPRRATHLPLGRLFLLGLAAALLAACGPAAGPSTGSPARPSGSQPAPPAPSASAPGPADWDETVAAAKREGKVVVSGPANAVWREQLTAFQKEYPEIPVEYTGANSRDFFPRVSRERAGGQYLWDVRVGGTDPQVFAAKDEGMFEPARSLLVLPDVVDDSKWFGGYDSIFADKERRFIPGFLATLAPIVFVNRDQAPDVRTERDLLDPKWKGKIVIQDPRGGATLAALATFLKVHGEQYLRDLLSQDLVVSNDNRQVAEWVVRGRYPLAIGLRHSDLLVFQQEGLGKNVEPLRTEAVPLSIGSGGIQALSQPPHPNAAKVFSNWLMTQRAQQALTQATGDSSRRTDVPSSVPEMQPDPAEWDTYVPHQDEALLPVRVRALELTSEVLK